MRTILILLSLMLFLTPPVVQAQTERWADDFAAADWKAVPADGVRATIETVKEGEESFLRLHYSFDRGGGFVVLRHIVELNLAANFVLTFDVRAEGPNQNLEVKLLDDAVAAAGGNVWWINRPTYEFSRQWQTITQRRKHFGFAWGPEAKKPLGKIQAIEFGIASASGGKGHVDFRHLRYEARSQPRPLGTVITRINGVTSAAPITLEKNSLLELDLGGTTEIGGISLPTGASAACPPLLVEAIADSGQSVAKTLVTWEPGVGYFAVLPECECAKITLHCIGEGTARIQGVNVHPPAWSDTANHLIESLASELPRGRLPRWANKEQNYWTVCGGLGRDEETLMSEDGAIELGRIGPTLEPFIQVDGKLLSWADAQISQELIDGDLPLPRVVMRYAAAPWLELSVTLIEDEGRFLASYEIANTDKDPQHASLLLAVRPFQVLPPTQWLNLTGGFAANRSLKLTVDSVKANDSMTARFSPASSGVGIVTGLAADLSAISLQHEASTIHETRRLQGVLKFDASLSNVSKKRWIATLGGDGPVATEADFDAALTRAQARWHAAVNHVHIQLPLALKDLEDTIRAQQGYILVNQDGDGTQPGSRTYERSWIRDGALTSVAMLRLGDSGFTKRFLDWYANFQYDNGKIPCVVDKRGSDPVDEHDSTGEYLYAVQMYFAYTGDRVFLDRHWPHVQKGVEYLHHLISLRSTPQYRDGDGLQGAMYGLVPESISHEGYSAKPMHSYWDCYFTSRGLHDAAKLALAHGDSALADKWVIEVGRFDECLATSLAKAQKYHNINYIPGCVELGDFDATSTAIGVWPCDYLTTEHFKPSLGATLDRYTDFFRKRQSGELQWKDYTPYELRLVGVIATQRDPEFALEMLRYFMRDQRPNAWRHWAEVVGHDAREGRFIGDMPHTWCGTEFLNSILNMVVLESGDGVVIGAGIPWSIFEPTKDDPQPTLSFTDIRTRLGNTTVKFCRTSATELSIDINLSAIFKPEPNEGLATLLLPPRHDWELLGPFDRIRVAGGREYVALHGGRNTVLLRTATKH